MSATLAITPAGRRRLGRSTFAIAAALVANAALTLAVDQLLHVLGVYPPWGEPMHEPALYLLALAYRLPFGVGSGYLLARLAPGAPARPAMVLGVIATALSAAGIAATVERPELGPLWYPIALALLAYPTIRLGVAWHERRARGA